MPSSSTARDFVAAGRFELRSELGRGATGVVYEAWDRERGTAVAIKTLRNLGPAALLLLKKEFRALQDVQHPNLVQLGELIEDRGQWYLTMELVDGAPILAYVRPEASAASRGGPSGRRPYDEARLRGAFAELARGLVALHGAHKVHRDIKPPNVLVTRTGRTVILDFGVVTELRRDRAPEDGSLFGTVAYMAPEQAAGEAVGPAADWYAFGVVLFQALTGRLPLEGTADEILRAKLTATPPRPSALDASVPADLDALCAKLLQTEPEARPSGPAVLSVLEGSARDELGAERSADVFVGREDELAALTRAFDDARTSGAVSVTVSGESGVGKSSLVRRFVEHIVRTHPGVVVFSGRCYERESVHYKGVDDLVDDISAFLLTLPERELAETVPTHAGLLARAFPVLQQVPGFEPPPDMDEALVPRELRERVFQAARELLTRIARQRPVIGFIDDLQWADADSLALLGEVLRGPDAPPMLLLATMRTGTETRRRGKGPSFELAGDVRTLHVEKLPASDAEQLVVQLLAGSSVDASQARAIAAEAKGHPLFIDELVRTRVAGGGRRDVVRLDDALWARVQALAPTARTLLELLCVIGSPVSQDVAARAAAISWGALFDAVTTLRAERLVRIDGARPEDAIAPYHDRVRESVVARLDAESRRAWHAHFAAALENTREEDPEALAFHWLEGGNPKRARDYAVRAAENAARSFAFDRAAELYRAALSMGLEDDRAALLERRWAEALSNAGRDAEAARVWLRLASKADPAAAVSLRQSAAEAFLCSGHFEQGQAVLEDVVRAAGLYMPKTPAGALLLLVLLRIVLAVRGLGFVAREEREADAEARMRLDAAWSAARGLVMHDNVRGLYFQMHSLLGALATGDRRRLVRTLAMEAMAGGAPDKARTLKLLAETRRHAEALGTPYELGMAEFAEGGARYFWGEWPAAVELLLRAESIFRERCVGVTWELTSAHLMLNSSMTYCGRLRELAVRLPTLLREAEKRNDRYALVNLRTTGTSILGFAQGRTEAVADVLERQLAELTPDAFRVQHYLCLYALVNVDLDRGKPEAAHARIAAAWPAMKRAMLLRVPIILIQSLEQRCRAAVAWAAKDPAVAPARLREADGLVRALEGLGRAFPWAGVMASATKACIARVRRAPDDVVAAALLDAATSSERHGMALVAWNLLLTRSKLLGLEREHEELAARMRDEGIVEPMRLAAMFVPGFGGGRCGDGR